MTDNFRREIKSFIVLNEDANQGELAESIGISRQYLNKVLNGHSGKMPAVWEKLLDKLDMTVMPIPNSKPYTLHPLQETNCVPKAIIDTQKRPQFLSVF